VLGERREAHDIGEQDSDDATFLVGQRVEVEQVRGGRQWCAAVRAEARAVGDGLRARRTCHEGSIVERDPARPHGGSAIVPLADADARPQA
jgi:hypothetical protein